MRCELRSKSTATSADIDRYVQAAALRTLPMWNASADAPGRYAGHHSPLWLSHTTVGALFVP